MKIKINKKGKIQVKGIIIIFAIILVAVTFGVLGWWYRNIRIPNDDQIIITQDIDFTEKYKLPGSGTKEDPFRIENKAKEEINRIEISDTTKYFIVQNCDFVNLLGDVIILSNVTNGTALICNNTFVEDRVQYGNFIKITSTINCSIIKNTFDGRFSYGIMDGIYISNSIHTKIIGNHMFALSYAILIQDSDNSNISKNEIDLVTVDAHRDAIKIYESNNVSVIGNVIQYAFYGISSSNSNYIIVKNNSLNHCSLGLNFYAIEYSSIFQNKINDSYDTGIKLRVSNYNNIYNNSIELGRLESMYLYICQFNNISYNTFLNGTEYALRLYLCDNSTIWNNNFIENNLNGTLVGASLYYQQAYDNDINDWYDKILLLGNYWSDLSWNSTATYTIDWGSNVDLHPLEFPV